MQQTIQFDPQIDPVSTVLLQVARAYGFTGITEAMASNGKPVGVYPKREPQVAWQPLGEVAWGNPSERDAEKAFEEKSPWTEKRSREFIHNLTIPAQRGMALLAVMGEVTLDEMSAYLEVDSLQGVFSTIGAAVRNTKGLPAEARPYTRYRSPKRMYRIEPGLQSMFLKVYETSPRVQGYLAQAQQYFETLRSGV